MTKDTKRNIVPELTSSSRRKVVKRLVGGATALAAYNMMPAKWGVPIIEQVFLPAHAATSGELPNGNFNGNVNVGSYQREMNVFDHIAEVGETVGDFLVPEANAGHQAPSAPGIDGWYVTIADGVATIMAELYFGCRSFSGQASSTITGSFLGYGSYPASCTFSLEYVSADSVKLNISISIDGSTYTGSQVLTRTGSSYSCNLPD